MMKRIVEYDPSLEHRNMAWVVFEVEPLTQEEGVNGPSELYHTVGAYATEAEANAVAQEGDNS